MMQQCEEEEDLPGSSPSVQFFVLHSLVYPWVSQGSQFLLPLSFLTSLLPLYLYPLTNHRIQSNVSYSSVSYQYLLLSLTYMMVPSRQPYLKLVFPIRQYVGYVLMTVCQPQTRYTHRVSISLSTLYYVNSPNRHKFIEFLQNIRYSIQRKAALYVRSVFSAFRYAHLAVTERLKQFDILSSYFFGRNCILVFTFQVLDPKV